MTTLAACSHNRRNFAKLCTPCTQIYLSSSKLCAGADPYSCDLSSRCARPAAKTGEHVAAAASQKRGAPPANQRRVRRRAVWRQRGARRTGLGGGPKVISAAAAAAAAAEPTWPHVTCGEFQSRRPLADCRHRCPRVSAPHLAARHGSWRRAEPSGAPRAAGTDPVRRAELLCLSAAKQWPRVGPDENTRPVAPGAIGGSRPDREPHSRHAISPP